MTALLRVYWYHIGNLKPKEGDMGDTIKSGGGPVNIGKTGGTANQTINTYTTHHVPVEELLRLLEAVKAQLPNLPEEVRSEVRNEVEGAELQVRKDKPDQKKIADKLTNVATVLAAIPKTVAAAVTVFNLVQQALKAVGL